MPLVIKKPNFPPYVCIVCGVGDEETREWYVDLQLNLDNHFNPVLNGAVYCCNLCWESLAQEVVRQVQSLIYGGIEPWAEFVTPSYESEDELIGRSRTTDGTDVSESELDHSAAGTDDPESPGISSGAESSDSGPSRSDPEAESGDSDAKSTGLGQFRAFFGGTG